MSRKVNGRVRRKLRIRKKVSGSSARPRLTVFRSTKHIYAQVIDDIAGKTLAHASSQSVEGAEDASTKSEIAKLVGKRIGKLCKDSGISRVVFDRNGYIYHGRIRALADAAREAGLEF